MRPFPAALAAAVLAATPAFAPAARAADGDSAPELVYNLSGFSSAVSALAFSPDGTLLAAAGEKMIRLYDVQTGELEHTLRGPRQRGAIGGIGDLAFSPDGHWLIAATTSGAERGLRLYRTDNWEEIAAAAPDSGGSLAKAFFGADGRTLYVLSSGGRLTHYAFGSRGLEGVRSSAQLTTKDQVVFALTPASRDALLLWKSDAPISLLSADDVRQSVAPAGEALRSGQTLMMVFQQHRGRTRIGRVFDLPGGALVMNTHAKDDPLGPSILHPYVRRGNQFRAAAAFGGHRSWATAVAVDAARGLAASGDRHGLIFVWRIDDGQVRRQVVAETAPIQSAAFLPQTDRSAWAIGYRHGIGPEQQVRGFHSEEGPLERSRVTRVESAPSPNYRIASAGDGKADDRFARVIDRLSNRETGRYTFTLGHRPTAAAFPAGGTLGLRIPAAVGTRTGQIVLFDGSENARLPRREFVGHFGEITSLDVSGDGTALLSASTDGTIRLWPLTDAERPGSLPFRTEHDLVADPEPGLGFFENDRILRVDGRTWETYGRDLLYGDVEHRPGDRVRVEIERGDRTLTLTAKMVPGYDVVEPLLTFLPTRRAGEWIVHTPDGYYNAVPGADRLIGYHLNRGETTAAEFHPVQEFRDSNRKPDLIREVWRQRRPARNLVDAHTAKQRDEGLADIAALHATFQSPRPGQRVVGRTVTVAGKLSGADRIEEAYMLVNGASVDLRIAADGAFRRTVDVVPGEDAPRANTIDLYVATAAGADVRAGGVNFEALGDAGALPKLIVLAVGVSEYADASQNIPTWSAGAERFVQIARQAEGKLYSEVIVAEGGPLLNENATRTAVVRALFGLKNRSAAGDHVFVYLAGHGQVHDDRYFFLPHDADFAQVRGTTVTGKELVDAFDTLEGRQLFFFLDTCQEQIAGAAEGGGESLNDLSRNGSGVTCYYACAPAEKAHDVPSEKTTAFALALRRAVAAGGDGPAGEPVNTRKLAAGMADVMEELFEGTQTLLSNAGRSASRPKVLVRIPAGR